MKLKCTILQGKRQLGLFGNFEYYWIGDRGKRRVKRLAERFADCGMVGFMALQRMDATLVLPEAVKSLTVKSK